MISSSDGGARALRLVAHGWTVEQIAEAFHTSPSSVARRLAVIYRSLGARNAAHAVVIAAIDGLLTREDLKAAYEDRRRAPEGEG